MRLESSIHWLEPRPAYPGGWHALHRLLSSYSRSLVLSLALTIALRRPFAKAAAAWPFSDRAFFMAGAMAAHTGTLLVFQLVLALAPTMHTQISRRPAELPSASLLGRMRRDLLVNHLVTSPISGFLLYPLAMAFGMGLAADPLPSLAHCAAYFALAVTGNSWGFYWTHRLLHFPKLYHRFHKQHHSFHGTIATAAEYAHPVEVVISNQLPTLGPLLILGVHPLIFMVWICVRLWQTYEAHSGYYFGETLLGRIGLSASAEAAFHDHHHIVNRGNFGEEYLDWIFGTMDHYVSLGGARGYIKDRKQAASGS